MLIFGGIVLVGLVVLWLWQERTDDVSVEAMPAEESAAVSIPTGYDVFGKGFDVVEAIPVETVAAAPDDYVGETVKLEGRVSEVCQAMGCWLTLQVPNGDNVRIVVPRDENGDYVFTVAKDISGRRAVVQGTLAGEVVSEHDQHHYAEDAGHAPEEHHADGEHEAATAAKPELQLTASGVLVEKANT